MTDHQVRQQVRHILACPENQYTEWAKKMEQQTHPYSEKQKYRTAIAYKACIQSPATRLFG